MATQGEVGWSAGSAQQRRRPAWGDRAQAAGGGEGLQAASRSGPARPERPRPGSGGRGLKVLTFAHRLEVGGTQLNAIELSASLRDDHGFDVAVFATPGPMEGLLHRKGLRLLPAPDARLHPSPARMRALRAAVRQEKPDLIHAWDWWQGLEAYLAVHLPMGVPLVITDMMMELMRVLPRGIPTTFGTPLVREQAKGAGWRRTDLLLPPIDVEANSSGAVDAQGFRRSVGAEPGEVVLVSVSRLTTVMKSESLIRSIAVMRELGREMPLKLVIVGDGNARPELDRLATEANAELGRRAVVLTGQVIDPREAYSAADIVIGMGGSALRGMALGKPVIVVGERGFAEVLSPESASRFLHAGMYGHGQGDPENGALSRAIRLLASDRFLRSTLGAFGRDFVTRHHSLDAVSGRLARFCHLAVEDGGDGTRDRAGDLLRSFYFYCRERRFLTASRDVAPSGRP